MILRFFEQNALNAALPLLSPEKTVADTEIALQQIFEIDEKSLRQGLIQPVFAEEQCSLLRTELFIPERRARHQIQQQEHDQHDAEKCHDRNDQPLQKIFFHLLSFLILLQ